MTLATVCPNCGSKEFLGADQVQISDQAPDGPTVVCASCGHTVKVPDADEFRQAAEKLVSDMLGPVGKKRP